MHVKSDVFCSGSVILPDKGGRILNVGGWSLDSTKGVRLYTPDGTAGVNGTNDWQENFNELALQRQRWYPSRYSFAPWKQILISFTAATVLANGSVLVIGGETGSNAAPQPNLEILPNPGGKADTVIELDWLARTDPYNLYPFVYVLPSGRIFISKLFVYPAFHAILIISKFTTTRLVSSTPTHSRPWLNCRTFLDPSTTVSYLCRHLICH